MTRHLLDITDLSPGELRHVVSLSVAPPRPLLAGKGVALIFEKPSNRTRHSMEMAVVQMGGHPVYTRGEEVGLDTREPVEDATRILAGYHAVIAARVFTHSTVARMAACSSMPVVNMLSDRSHPLQAVADVITMREHAGPIDALHVAWIGDYNNVARSLAEAVLMLGGSMAFGCPGGFGPPAEEVGRLRAIADRVTSSADPVSAVTGAHVVHTDTWVSMGQESESAERMKVFSGYCVDEKLMSAAAPGAAFMHCMPAYRGKEVTAEVMDGPRSLAIAQGHHRLTAARGVLAFLMEAST
jgi:ornithine carbamoyltransferase